MPEPISVALVDDDPLVLRLLTDMLTASGIDVAWAAQGADEAVARLGTDAPQRARSCPLGPDPGKSLHGPFGPLTAADLARPGEARMSARPLGWTHEFSFPSRERPRRHAPVRAPGRARRRHPRPPGRRDRAARPQRRGQVHLDEAARHRDAVADGVGGRRRRAAGPRQPHRRATTARVPAAAVRGDGLVDGAAQRRVRGVGARAAVARGGGAGRPRG